MEGWHNRISRREAHKRLDHTKCKTTVEQRTKIPWVTYRCPCWRRGAGLHSILSVPGEGGARAMPGVKGWAVMAFKGQQQLLLCQDP